MFVIRISSHSTRAIPKSNTFASSVDVASGDISGTR